MDHHPATNAEQFHHEHHVAAADWHPLQGMQLGHLPGLAPGTDVPVLIASIADEAPELAIADRVAFVLTRRTGVGHVVLEGTGIYYVARLTPELDWAAAMRLVTLEHMPRIISVASAEGILPMLISA